MFSPDNPDNWPDVSVAGVSWELGKFCVIYSSLWELDSGQTLWQDVLWFGWSWHAQSYHWSGFVGIITELGAIGKIMLSVASLCMSNNSIELEIRREIILSCCPNKIKTLSRCDTRPSTLGIRTDLSLYIKMKTAAGEEWSIASDQAHLCMAPRPFLVSDCGDGNQSGLNTIARDVGLSLLFQLNSQILWIYTFGWRRKEAFNLSLTFLNTDITN